MAMGTYVALGDSISIDDYTGLPGGGAASQLARKLGFGLCHGHGLASDEPWFVQVIEPNLAAATAIAEHWHELLSS